MGVGVYLGWNLSTIGLIIDWAVDTKIVGISLNDINLKPLVSFSMVVGSRIIRGSFCVALSTDLLLSVFIPMLVVFIILDGFFVDLGSLIEKGMVGAYRLQIFAV